MKDIYYSIAKATYNSTDEMIDKLQSVRGKKEF